MIGLKINPKNPIVNFHFFNKDAREHVVVKDISFNKWYWKTDSHVRIKLEDFSQYNKDKLKKWIG